MDEAFFPITDQRRNRNYAETHRALIEQAVTLIARDGVEALSVAALARTAGMNRSTVYYHFESRDALIAAVKQWARDRLSLGFQQVVEHGQRAGQIVNFVLANPEIVRLWIEDFIAPGDIRERYPSWDGMMLGIEQVLKGVLGEEDIDAEVWSVMMLAAVFIGPRVFKNSIRPDLDITRIAERFGREQQRFLEKGRNRVEA